MLALFFHEPGISPLSFTLRMVLAFVLGGAVGFERGLHNQAMGMRTHILICLSSTLVMGLGLFLGQENTASDPARIAAQVVSGIGFLGAGTILRYGMDIKGLTTAASIWATAALGLAIGAGLYLPSVMATAAFLATLHFLAPVSHRVSERSTQALVMLQGRDLHLAVPRFMDAMQARGVRPQPPAVEYRRDTGHVRMSFHVKLPADLDPGLLVQALSEMEGVESAGIEQLK